MTQLDDVAVDNNVTDSTAEAQASTTETKPTSASLGVSPLLGEEDESEAVVDLTTADDTNGEQGAAEEGEEKPETDPEAVEVEPEEVEPVPPPQWWSDEDKAKWADTPKDIQDVVLRREQERDAHINKIGAKAKHAEKDAYEKASGEYATELARNAWLVEQMFPAPQVEQPDMALLYGSLEEQAEYHRQKARSDQLLAQHSQVQQTVMSMRAEAQATIDALKSQDRQAEFSAIVDAFPVLADVNSEPAKALLSNLTQTAAELGYSAETLIEATSTDFKAIETAAKWKAGYDKWEKAQKDAKMKHARLFKTPAAIGGSNKVSPKGGNPETQMLKELYPTNFNRN
jgi:hypothetical protein